MFPQTTRQPERCRKNEKSRPHYKMGLINAKDSVREILGAIIFRDNIKLIH